MLADRLKKHDVPVWLVNTGWTGGPYGVGHRMSIDHTRVMVRAALNGELADVPFDEVTFLGAGINHQSFILRFERAGEDLYPLLDEAIAREAGTAFIAWYSEVSRARAGQLDAGERRARGRRDAASDGRAGGCRRHHRAA